MTYKYQLDVRMKTRNLVSRIGEIEDSVNSTMKEFGFREEMFLESSIPLILTTDRELTLEEQNEVLNLVRESFQEQDQDMICDGITKIE